MRSLKIPAPRNFNNLIRQNQTLGSDSDLNQSTTVPRVQSPGSSAQSPASLVQRPTLAPKAQEFRYAQKTLNILRLRKTCNLKIPQSIIYVYFAVFFPTLKYIVQAQNEKNR